MKNNVNYVIQGILAIAVIILFVMYFSGKKSNTSAMRSATAESGEQIAGFPARCRARSSKATYYPKPRTS